MGTCPGDHPGDGGGSVDTQLLLLDAPSPPLGRVKQPHRGFCCDPSLPSYPCQTGGMPASTPTPADQLSSSPRRADPRRGGLPSGAAGAPCRGVWPGTGSPTTEDGSEETWSEVVGGGAGATLLLRPAICRQDRGPGGLGGGGGCPPVGLSCGEPAPRASYPVTPPRPPARLAGRSPGH